MHGKIYKNNSRCLNSGRPAYLLLSVMGRRGPTSVTVGEVGLIPVSRAENVSRGSTTDMGNGDILVTVDAVPQGEFVVILTGTDAVSGSRFQRQSTTQMSVSKVIIMVSLIKHTDRKKRQLDLNSLMVALTPPHTHTHHFVRPYLPLKGPMTCHQVWCD